MAETKEHMKEIGKKTRFSSENQPLPEAKSEGWKRKKLIEEARDRVLEKMYERAGLTPDGDNKLDVDIADKALHFLETGNIEGFMTIWREVLPAKQTKTDITTKGEKITTKLEDFQMEALKDYIDRQIEND